MKTAFPRFTNVVTIRLYSNIPFDNTYKHHSLISKGFTYNSLAIMGGAVDSVTAKERFIDRKNWAVLGTPYYYPRYDMTGEYNFDFSNGLVCSVTLELTPEQTNANYMRVKVGKDGSGYDYYYYFITSISQLNADTYKLGLELDVLMTYQDEFLEGIHNVPVFTSRKHCHRFTDDGLMPFSTDLKTGDDTFAGVKPTILEKVYELDYHTTALKSIRDVVWLYICCDAGDFKESDFSSSLRNFTCNDIEYPFITLVLPINVNSFKIEKQDATEFNTLSASDIRNIVCDLLINNGAVHGAKLSNYPPFTGGHITLDNYGTLTIKASSSVYTEDGGFKVMSFDVSGNQFFSVIGTLPAGFDNDNLFALILSGVPLIYDMYLDDYAMDVANFGATFVNADAPTPTDSRFFEPKLMFSPFKKYVLSSAYSSEGCEIYPELMFSEYVTDDETDYFKFGSITTPYMGDYSVFTFLKPVTFGTEKAFNEYRINKIGLSGTMNYTMPVGENALDVFNATQSNAFYQSKTASGITGGLSIAGGVGSIALGVAGLFPSMGMSAPMSAGLIAGGVTAMAGGIAGVVNTIKSTTAKIEDLKNTPDSVNVAGSNFLTDDTIMHGHHKMPFLSVYNISSVVKQNAEDYFYNYGYQVARECYFNTALDYSATNHTDDNNLLGRTIFNYIQLNDDIVNKINYNMPQIIKQKLSNIFNNGITLWSWFGLQELWAETPTDPTSTYYLDRWFMKCELDNTEFNILIENQ